MGIDIDSKLIRMAWKNLHRYNHYGHFHVQLYVYLCVLLILYNCRDHFPALAPDGRPFPFSLTQSRDPVTFPLPVTTTAEERTGNADTEGQAKVGFPHNIEFIHVSTIIFMVTYTFFMYSLSFFFQGNYVPSSDSALDHQVPEYDVILALSLTKWIHLNWGDDGIKRFFRKVYLHLRPGGSFIVEPQPFSSYGKKKNVSVSSILDLCPES